jgi:hypothetical protein
VLGHGLPCFSLAESGPAVRATKISASLYFSLAGESPWWYIRGSAGADMAASYSGVKVFSATKARERELIGDRINEWLDESIKQLEIVDTVVTQSSDREFHCLTITIFYRPR